MPDRLTLKIDAGVAEVRLTRGEKSNALDDAMFEALIATGERLKVARDVRAVVLSAEGRAFCAGLDLATFKAMSEAGGAGRLLTASRTPGGANRAQQAVMVWREVPVPVIAALQGPVFGGGLQLALGCDLRFAAGDAQLSVMEIRWGLVPDMGGLALLPELVRADVARDLLWSGRVVGGEEALALGLVTRLCADPRVAALDYARQVAMRSPDAVRAGKRLLNAASRMSLAEVLLRESEEQLALIGSANQLEAVAANLEKREPRFTDGL